MKVKKLCDILPPEVYVGVYQDGNYLARVLPSTLYSEWGEKKVVAIWDDKLRSNDFPNWGSIINVTIK